MSEAERNKKAAELTALKEQLKEVHGTKCLVFSRVVGYLTPVQHWNKGKKEEFTMRSTYTIE